jgi:HAD superfamily hydrolase (TIGR01509 family)
MVRAIIFDCFGVLVGKGFEATYRSAGGDPVCDRIFIDDTLGKTNLGLMSETEFQTTMADQLQLSLEVWQQVMYDAEQPDTELLAYIKELRGSYKTAVLSNANTGVLERRIGLDWLAASFDEVVVSAEVGMTKPDERIYTYTLQKLGVAANQAIFVDDREVFLGAAREVGMQTILYQHFEQFKTELEQLLSQSNRS